MTCEYEGCDDRAVKLVHYVELSGFSARYCDPHARREKLKHDDAEIVETGNAGKVDHE